MADEPMEILEIISTENRGPSVKISFSKELQYNIRSKSPIIDIYDMAEIQVLHNCHTFFFQVRKCELANKLGVQLHVVCKNPAYEETFLCTKDWRPWVNMGNYNGKSFNIQIEVVTSQADLMALQLYKDEEFTDFQLSAAEGSVGVAVHKAQLAANSEVFKTMLTREWKETTEGRINMEGVTLQTLQYLKDYMYMGDLPEGEDGLCSLLLIARCYLMYKLKAECLKKLTETVTSENFYHILEFSFFNKLPELTVALVGATSKKIADDALEIMIENEKKQTEQKQSDEGTNE